MPQRIRDAALVAVLCVFGATSALGAERSLAYAVSDTGIEFPSPSEVRAGIVFGSCCNLAPDNPSPSLETGLRARLLKAQYADPWTSVDKVQHALFSLLATLSTQYFLVNKAGWSESASLPASVIITAAAGMGKEIYDWGVGSSHHFCSKDLAADVLGIGIAAILISI